MTVNPEDMTEAEDSAYWLELTDDGYVIYEGETKEESVEVHSADGWFTGHIQEIDRDAGEFDDSRMYTLRTEAVDGAVLLWGKADINRKVDNAALQTDDTIALQRAGSVDVGRENDMHKFDVRFNKN